MKPNISLTLGWVKLSAVDILIFSSPFLQKKIGIFFFKKKNISLRSVEYDQCV